MNYKNLSMLFDNFIFLIMKFIIILNLLFYLSVIYNYLCLYFTNNLYNFMKFNLFRSFFSYSYFNNKFGFLVYNFFIIKLNISNLIQNF